MSRLRTSYAQDMALLNTPAKRSAVAALLAVAIALPFLITDALLVVLATGLAACIGALGLNLVTGYAGQVSLGHAFFLGIGAYTAAVISGDPEGSVLGFGITLLPVWLPAAGLMAAVVGLIVSPLAVRLRGLYLAVVTIGLVFLGEHIFKEWDSVTGGPGVGRPSARPELFGLDLGIDGALLTREQKLYLLMLALVVVFAIAARNIARSDVGRAFAAIRDRDIAAAVVGVHLTRQKAVAFTVSSFYAGCAGALVYTVTGFVEPGSFSLLLSVQYVAMVLIGGVATISGSILGALFISSLNTASRELAANLPFVGAITGGGALNVFQLEGILYGLLIIGFLIFEPRGLHGIWLRAHAYWKAWPFTY
jgi:branched-chain amino acid transport system permease protein